MVFQESEDGTWKAGIEKRDGIDYIVIISKDKKVECPLDEFNEIGLVLGVRPISAKDYYAKHGN